MNTHFNARLVAVAVATLFAAAAAQAGPSGPYDGHDGHDGHDQGGIVVKGSITVGASAGAQVDSTQNTGGVLVSAPMSYPPGGDHGDGGDGGHGNPPTPANGMQASVGNSAGASAKGNVGLNSAAGAQNVQSNDTAIAAIAATNVFGAASVANTQGANGNSLSGNNSTAAALGDSALSGASGNVTANVAAGVGNAQSNGMAITKSANPVLAMATATNAQIASGNTESGSFSNTAAINCSALANAAGNIGVNVASGVGNLQHNGLSLIQAP